MPLSKQILFSDFWLLVASELGDARLVLNKDAKTISGFINKNSDVRAYLHTAIKQSYKLSRCDNLHSPISLEHVLDILGETAHQLQQSALGDLFDIELLEEIAWLICDRYASQVSELVQRSAAWEHAPHSSSVTKQQANDFKQAGEAHGITGVSESSEQAQFADNQLLATPKYHQNNAQNRLDKPRLAPVVSFPNFKIRKANAKL